MLEGLVSSNATHSYLVFVDQLITEICFTAQPLLTCKYTFELTWIYFENE